MTDPCVICGGTTGPTVTLVGTCGAQFCLFQVALRYRDERDKFKALCECTLKQLDVALNVLQENHEEVTHG